MKLNDTLLRVAGGSISQADLDTLDRSDVLAVKAGNDLPQFRLRASDPIVSKDSRTISWVVSDESVDRMGDIIRVSGWDLANYKQNPVVIWNHDTHGSIPPIGRAPGIRVGQKRGGDPALIAPIEFAPKGAHPFADTLYELAAAGFIKATSVGFLPKRFKVVDDAEERKALGLGPFGVVFEEQELLENSLVNVPANPAALTNAVDGFAQRGLISRDSADEFLHAEPSTHDIYAERARAKVRGFVELRSLIPGVEDKAAPEDLKKGDMVRWKSSGGTARGRIERVERDGKIDVPDSSFTVTGTADDPAALIRVYRDGEPTDTMVGHKFSTLSKDSAKMDQNEDHQDGYDKPYDEDKNPEMVTCPKCSTSFDPQTGRMMGDPMEDEQQAAAPTGERRSDMDRVLQVRQLEQMTELTHAMRQLVDTLTDQQRAILDLAGVQRTPEGGRSEDVSDQQVQELERRVLESIQDAALAGEASALERKIANLTFENENEK